MGAWDLPQGSTPGEYVSARSASIDMNQVYGLVPGNDVTTALQSALNTLAAAGTGGEAVFTIPGTYTVNGPLVSATVDGYTYNGQVLIPAVGPTDNVSLALTIRGSVLPMGGGEGRPAGGGVTLVSNATAGFMFDCIPANTAFSSPNPWTNVTLTFEGLILQLPNNPQCGAINALCALQLRTRDLYIQTAFYTSGIAPPALTGTTEAIVVPGYQSEGMHVFERTEFRNVPIAFRPAEHMLLLWVGAYYANIVFNCTAANNGHGIFINKLDLGNCLTVFKVPTDLSSNPLRVYGTIDIENIVQNMVAFVDQPNPTGNNGSIIGALQIVCVNSGGFPMLQGTSGDANLLGRLEITNEASANQSWKSAHPIDSFARISSPLTAGTPGLSNPTFHPWTVQQGSFTVTSGTGIQSSSATSICLVPAKNNGESRLVQATFVLPASGFNACLVTSWCKGSTGGTSDNWIGAHIHGSGAIDLVTGNSSTITTLVTGTGLTSGGSTVTVGVEVILNPLGIPQWVALYVNGVLKLTYGLTAAQQTALNFTTGGTPPLQTGGRYNSVWDGLIFIGDMVTAVTLFQAQNALPPLPSVASGTATLAAGTIAVANTEITSTSIIRLNRQATGGTLGELSVALTAGTGFTINSSSGSETSTVFWEIVSY